MTTGRIPPQKLTIVELLARIKTEQGIADQNKPIRPVDKIDETLISAVKKTTRKTR